MTTVQAYPIRIRHSILTIRHEAEYPWTVDHLNIHHASIAAFTLVIVLVAHQNIAPFDFTRGNVFKVQVSQSVSDSLV
jgi:hypothetical protein